MITPSASGGISESEVTTLVDAALVSSSYTDTGTTGTVTKSTTTVDVTPTANSSRVVFARKVEINYSSNFNITTGGWLTASEKVINTEGSGTIDKLVADMTQLNLTGGNIAAAVGYEAEVSAIAASTLVGGYAGFYFPNLSGVANIGNITTIAALQNDHTNAHILNRGKYLNGEMVELTPPYHIGLLAGRYYSAPAKSMTTNVMSPDVIYTTFITVPSRTTITKLGFNVTTGLAGNGILGLYKVVGSTLTTLVAQTSSISTATTGEKEGTISATVDAGTYALVGVFSSASTLSWHEISSHAAIGASTATGYSEQAYIAPFTFGALPATANIVPTFAANTIEPHFWYRIGV